MSGLFLRTSRRSSASLALRVIVQARAARAKKLSWNDVQLLLFLLYPMHMNGR
jgi:hypothetical protein